MNENRRDTRIDQPHVIRFRQLNPKPLTEDWDIAFSINISKSGILFNCQNSFDVGVELELKINNPTLKTDGIFKCTVVRCQPSPKLNIFYEVVVTIDEGDEEAKREFYKVFDSILENKSDQ